MLRIAVGGIHTECSTYSPVLMHGRGLPRPPRRGPPRRRLFRLPAAPTDVDAPPPPPRPRRPRRPGRRADLRRLQGRVPRPPARRAAARRRLSRHARRDPRRRHGGRRGRLDRRRPRDRRPRRPRSPPATTCTATSASGSSTPSTSSPAYRTAPAHRRARDDGGGLGDAAPPPAAPASAPASPGRPVPLLLPGERSSTEDEPARGALRRAPGVRRPPRHPRRPT